MTIRPLIGNPFGNQTDLSYTGSKGDIRLMTTIGDVLMVFGAIALISFSLFCSMVLFTLLLPARAAKMAHQLDTATARTIAIGAGIFIPVLAVIILLAALPLPVAKITALFIGLAFLGCAALGGTGLTRLLSDRIRSSSSEGTMSMLQTTSRAAGLIVGVFNIPLLGWFFLAPLFLFASLGSFAHGFLNSRVKEIPWQSSES